MTGFTRVLQALAPATRYAVRIEALNAFNISSGFSDAIDFETVGVLAAPNPPTNLVTNFNAANLFIGWTAPTLKTDGSLANDIAKYEIDITAQAHTFQYYTTNTNFTYLFNQNKSDFTTPQPQLALSIRAIDTSGNISAPLLGIAVNPIPDDPPSAPNLVVGFTFINVQMTAPVDVLDLDGFHLEHSLDGGTTWTTAADTKNGNDSYSDAVSQSTTVEYRYKIRDVFQQISANFSPVASGTTNNISGTFNSTPPSVPTDLAGAPGIDPNTLLPFIDATWTAATPSSPNVMNYYELRIRKAAGIVYSSFFIGAPTTNYHITGLSTDTTYEISVQAVDNVGNKSGFSSEVAVSTGHNLTPPATPTGFTAIGGVNAIFVNWNANSETDLSRYQLFASLTSGFTPAVGVNEIFEGNATGYVQLVNPSETWYYRLRAIDTAGNTSSFTTEFSGTSLTAPTFSRDTTPPGVPTGLNWTSTLQVVNQVDSVYVDVSWTPNTDPDLAGYVLEYKRSIDTNWATLNIVLGATPVSTTRIYGLDPGTSYSFAILAYDNTLNFSAYSAIVTHTTAAATIPPAAPSGLSASASLRAIILQWTANTEADFANYQIFISPTNGFTPTGTLLYDSPSQGTVERIDKYYNGSAWVDLVPGTTYYLKMRAVNRSSLTSSDSSQVSATPGFVNGPDIQAGTIVADAIASGTLTATLTLSGIIETASSGPRLVMDNNGLRGYAANGTTVNLNYDRASGNVTLSSGILTAPTITGGTIAIGSGNSIFKADSSGVYLGNASFGAAPFSVSTAGAVILKNLLIDSTGMNASTNIILTNGFALTAGGNVTATGTIASSNLIATGGTIGSVNISPTKLTGGTIEGATINVLNAGSINFTGSGGINWGATATGGIIVSNQGFIQSANYSSTTGWQLGPTGLDINQGSIVATSLDIGVSNANQLINSSFENGTTVASGWLQYPTSSNGNTYLIDSGQFLYQSKAQKITANGAGPAGISQELSFPGPIFTGTWIALSCWIYQNNGTPRTAVVQVVNNTSHAVLTSPTTTLGIGGWTRVTWVTQIDATVNIVDGINFNIYINNPAHAEAFWVDGAQLQFSTYITDYQPIILEIPNNYIQSAYISSLSADKLTSAQINTATLTIAGTGAIQSFNFGANAGYKLTATGALFQNGSITLIGAGGVLTLDPTSFRAIYGGNTQLLVDSSGVYMGGNNTSNAKFYVTNTGAAVFQSITSSGFLINTAATGTGTAVAARVLRAYPFGSPSDGSADTFYLTADGTGFFSNGVINLGSNPGQPGGTGLHIDANGNFVIGTNAAGFHIDNNGDIWSGATLLANAPFSVTAAGVLKAATGTFSGDLNAAGGTFKGDISAANGTFSGVLNSTSGTIGGTTISPTWLSGGVIAGARFTTGSPNILGFTGENHIEIDNTPFSGAHRIRFYSGAGESASGVGSIREDTAGNMILSASSIGNISLISVANGVHLQGRLVLDGNVASGTISNATNAGSANTAVQTQGLSYFFGADTGGGGGSIMSSPFGLCVLASGGFRNLSAQTDGSVHISPGPLFVSGVQYNSSREIKDNIQPVGSALAIVNAIKTVEYTRKNAPGKTQWGHIAEEVLQVHPAAVSHHSEEHHEEEGKYSLDVYTMLATLWKAVQELSDRIDSDNRTKENND